MTSVLIPHGVIQERVKKMARNILKDVMQEKASKLATTNICLTETEERETIRDLVIEEKNSFAGLMALVSDEEEQEPEKEETPGNILENFYEMMEVEELGNGSDMSNYSLALSDLLSSRHMEHKPGAS